MNEHIHIHKCETGSARLASLKLGPINLSAVLTIPFQSLRDLIIVFVTKFPNDPIFSCLIVGDAEGIDPPPDRQVSRHHQGEVRAALSQRSRHPWNPRSVEQGADFSKN